MTVQILEVWEDSDFRTIHRWRKDVLRRELRPGTAVLYFNRRGTMARVFTSEGDVVTLYAPKGVVFDVPEVNRRLRKGLGVSVEIHRKAAA